MREHARGRKTEDEREDQGEGGCEQESLAHKTHGRERVGKRCLEEHDRLLSERDGHVRIVPSAMEHAPPLDLAAHERCERDRVVGHVGRAARSRVGLHREGRSVRREYVERDDARIRRNRKYFHALLPEQPIVGERTSMSRGDRFELVEPGVDEPPLERRYDDHVRGTERAGDDPDENEHDTDPDSARERHAATRT